MQPRSSSTLCLAKVSLELMTQIQAAGPLLLWSLLFLFVAKAQARTNCLRGIVIAAPFTSFSPVWPALMDVFDVTHCGCWPTQPLHFVAVRAFLLGAGLYTVSHCQCQFYHWLLQLVLKMFSCLTVPCRHQAAARPWASSSPPPNGSASTAQQWSLWRPGFRAEREACPGLCTLLTCDTPPWPLTTANCTSTLHLQCHLN